MPPSCVRTIEPSRQTLMPSFAFANAIACTGLKFLYDSATAAGLSDQAATVLGYAQGIGCDWAQ